MELATYSSKRLARSALVLVAAQIDFEPVGLEITHAQARTIQKAMGDGWTNLLSIPLATTTITNEGFRAEPSRQAYRIAQKDETWAVVVRADAITLETKAYQMWEDFETHFKSMLKATATVLDPAQVLRVGVRFVDQFSLPDGLSGWDGLITNSLLGASSDERFADGVLVSDARVLLALDHKVKCLLRYGNFVDPSSNPKFLLDFDVYNDNHETFNPEYIRDELDKLHAYAGRAFRTSITDAFYEWLEGNS